jgi:rRNA maturation protein Nop10
MDNSNLISRFSIKDEKFNKFREMIKDELKKSIR